MQVHARTTLLGLSAVAALAAAPILSAQNSMDMSASVSATAQLPGLDSLVAPIALYPDPLVGIILPASTAPNDLQAAAQSGGQATDSWDPAVRDLSHYPELVQWMAGNQDWSNQLGASFANQPGQVMDAIQDLRHRAVDAGTLRSNAQVEVVTDGDMVRILPRDANVVYIPQYDPNAVFARGNAGVEITFGTGLPAGDWLGFYPVWGSHAVYAGDWYDYSRDHGGWHFNVATSSGLFHRGGISGVKGAREYRVADGAQIKQEQFRAKADVHGNYAHPAAFGARGSAQVGFQANRSDRNGDQARAEQQARSQQTFQGDQRRSEQAQRDQQAKDEQGRNAQAQTTRERQDQSRQTFQGDQQRNEQTMRDQQVKAGQDKNAQAQAQATRERQDQNRATFPGDEQRNSQAQRDQQAKSEQAKSQQEKSSERARGQTFQGDQPRVQDQTQTDQSRQYQQNQAKAEQNRNDAQSQPDRNMNRDETSAQKQGAYEQRSTTTNQSQNKDKAKNKSNSREDERTPSSAPSSPSSQ